MRITAIQAFAFDLPMKEGSYSWSGQSFGAFDSTVVKVMTDGGIEVFGEVCPLVPPYLPAYAEGARAGIAKLAPDLIGENPLELERINWRMDALLKGHPYVKSALDMACWDILGKATGQPVYRLLGGLFHERVKLFKVIGRAAPEVMADKLAEYRAMGFRQYQMKVGEDPATDIARIEAVAAGLETGELMTADANTGWRQHEALRVVDAARDSGLYIEQPCLDYEECLVVRRHCNLPMILDECMDSLAMLLRGHRDQAMDLVNLKISRLGGLTRARQFRDLCVSLGIVMTIEDTWGGDIATAAIAHLAHSTPEGFHFASSPFNDYTTLKIADGAPEARDGTMAASGAPGLGIVPRLEVLGAPIIDVA